MSTWLIILISISLSAYFTFLIIFLNFWVNKLIDVLISREDV